MKRGRKPKAVPRDIAALGGRIDRWRKTRGKRSPMPEALWNEATRLALLHGVSAVCRPLGLGYQPLRERAASASGPEEAQPDVPAFVELSAAQLVGSADLPPAQTVLELVDREGTRLSLRLAAGESLDVGALVESFRGRDR